MFGAVVLVCLAGVPRWQYCADISQFAEGFLEQVFSSRLVGCLMPCDWHLVQPNAMCHSSQKSVPSLALTLSLEASQRVLCRCLDSRMFSNCYLSDSLQSYIRSCRQFWLCLVWLPLTTGQMFSLLPRISRARILNPLWMHLQGTLSSWWCLCASVPFGWCVSSLESSPTRQAKTHCDFNSSLRCVQSSLSFGILNCVQGFDDLLTSKDE